MKQTKQLIERAYTALDVLTKHRDKLLDMCLAEERGHRRVNVGDYAVSVTLAAKQQVVTWIARYMTVERKMPSVAEYLSIRTDVFYSAALVAEYRDKIAKAWAEFDMPALAHIDYSKLVNGELP